MTTRLPTYTHDCAACQYLGATIGNGRIVDLYAHATPLGMQATLIARYGNDGPEYYSTLNGHARACGHAELFVAQALFARPNPA
jgi:hypothetical protein